MSTRRHSPLSLPRTLARLAAPLLLAAVLTACAATYDNHGFVPPPEELEQILVGVDTRGTIEETIGRPAASGVLRDEAWIYTAYRVRNYTYQAPQVIERDVVAISFDADGVVSNVERFGLEDGQLVQLSRRVTESSVRDLGFFRQLMRNLGRVDLGALGN
ncbi:outer membrane protein assembly factor BamE [Roseibacterium sp. SDUM158016]|jgi:outer membrane protein assembly factor BamE (lipoprotein component of BamABCDE complex)|uniref:outer membrane protein assembly factor BamE n=1 Tax=Roseicyclus sediminis TaxID=2980997 RepID=UPI0021D02046|nr:outer membrane protein assembly factor BamE [Roseibacterium sp. SDUM158016]MCU4653866.1 outer membrane protein assembly factor BamE [Roseibacterium sp. SDUM158016]